jgi:hypothetical protein
MHPHLIDWFRNIHITLDSALAERRWKTAQQYATKLSRGSLLALLRLFLSSKPEVNELKGFAEDLLLLDKEFPVANNTEELRLMAGVVMVTTFSSSSKNADAFALGLAAARFPDRKHEPAHPEILVEAEAYLRAEHERQRPLKFGEEPRSVQAELSAKYKEMNAAEATGEAPVIQTAQIAYHKLLTTAIEDHDYELRGQIRRLAEESAFLWWVVSEYSPTLKIRTAELTAPAYAMVCASEAAARTGVLPPPASADALLIRALKLCKSGSKKHLTLSDFLKAADKAWRAQVLQEITFTDCQDFVPLLTSVSKAEEFGDVAAVISVMPKLCPGFDVQHSLSAIEVAQQLYLELMFLKGLSAVEA